MQKIKKVPTKEEAYNRFSNLCARQECCPHDLVQKMEALGMANDTIAYVLKHLTEENFLNEERFCNAFVHDKLEFSRWGRLRISIELRRRNLPVQLVNKTLKNIDNNRYFEKLTELLTDYNHTLNAKSAYERRSKLLRYAFGHGFEQELTVNIVDKLCSNAEDIHNF